MRETTAIARAVIDARGVTRNFHIGSRSMQVLRGIDLSIPSGTFIALRGRSGSGKTTLLNILVGLDDPTTGQVQILGHDLHRLNESARAALRREQIGLLFQNAHLFPMLSAQENVELALRLQMVPARERTERALAALEMVGLHERARHRSMELSGGEQQRVALARALVHQPRFMVADEPTGNLDSQTGRKIIQLLRDVVNKTGIALLVATHDANVVEAADQILLINDGTVTRSK